MNLPIFSRILVHDVGQVFVSKGSFRLVPTERWQQYTATSPDLRELAYVCNSGGSCMCM